MFARLHRRVWAIAFIGFAIFTTLVWLPWVIQDRIAPGAGEAGQKEWIFWLQPVSGNWTPSENPPVSRWAFAVSAVIAVITNNAVGAVVIGLLWRLLAEWKKRMNLEQLLTSKEQVTREALDDAFPGDKEKVRVALEAASADWYPELISLVGEAAAQNIMKKMKKEI